MKNSIIFPSGERVNFETYNEFKDALEVVRGVQSRLFCASRNVTPPVCSVSYHDKEQGVHVVVFLRDFVNDGIEGMLINGQSIAKLSDRTLHETASYYVQLSFEDFAGWAIV